MSNGFVGNLMTITSERTRALRQEREQDDRAREEREQYVKMAPIRAAEAELNRTAQALAKVEREVKVLEFRERMSTQTFPDFSESVPRFDPNRYEDRDGNPIATQRAILAAVDKAGEKALTELGLLDQKDPNAQMLVKFVANHAAKQVDISDSGVWLSAWEFIVAKWEEFEKSLEPAPVPVAEPEPEGEFAQHEKLLARLRKELSEIPVGDTRQREKIERRIHREEIRRELLGDENYRAVMQEIVDASGLQIPESVSLKFREWLASPINRKRFSESKEDTRISFSEFVGNDCFLSEAEKAEIQRRRNNEAVSSDAVVRAVGKVNSYGNRPSAGIRQ